jgi:hypothetical protein
VSSTGWIYCTFGDFTDGYPLLIFHGNVVILNADGGIDSAWAVRIRWLAMGGA